MNKLVKYTLCIAASAAVLLFAGEESKASEKIADGVCVDDVDISNMTEEEANEALKAYEEQRGSVNITVKTDNGTITTTLAELGYKMKKNDFIKHGMNIGKTGNVIKKYKELKDVSNGGIKFETEFEYDEDALKAFVNDKCTQYDVPAKEPQMVKKTSDYIKKSSCEGLFDYVSGTSGKAINKEKTLKDLKSLIEKNKGESIDITPLVEDTQPKYTVDSLKKCTSLLGTYKTDFSSSSSARKVNIKNAVHFVNGTVVYPGEEFSILKKITPFNSKNGYQKAGSYAAGKVVDTYGGGVCQVSTTLYNAVMQAELEVTDRSCHSMCINYVPVSFDAAISESSGMDFKFKNNLDIPIYIEGYTESNKIIFSIYGYETRPSNRKVVYRQYVTDTIQPGADVITRDSSKPASYKKVTQSQHVGYKAKVVKEVYIDGELVSEEDYNKSSYKASPRYIVVGTKGTSTPTPAPTAGTDPTNAPDVTDKPENTEKPAVTEKPAATDKPVTSDKPAATEKPAVTEKPADKPAATKKPVATEKPAATEKPTVKPADETKPAEPEQAQPE